MEEFVTLTYNGKEIKLPVIIGTEGEKAIDISTPAGGHRLHHPGYRLRKYRQLPECHHLHGR